MEGNWNDEINNSFYITKVGKHKHWINDEMGMKGGSGM